MEKAPETTRDIRKGNSQISFRAPEIKEKLETIAREKGLTLAEYVKSMCEASLAIEPAKVISVKPRNPASETNSDFVVLLKENNEKHDQVIDLLGKLVETSQPEIENDLIYTEEEHSAALSKALIEQEREIKNDHLLICLTEAQQSIVSKLLDYRKEKGKIFSGSQEELFFFLMKDSFYEGFNSKNPEFKSEFKEAFAEYFQQVEF